MNMLIFILWLIITVTVVLGLGATFWFIVEYFGWDERIYKWLSKSRE